MFKYFISRCFGGVATMFGLSVIVFVALTSIPGSVVGSILGSEGSSSPETVDQLRKEFGLDRPWHIQFLSWIGRILRGDLGTSWVSGESVRDLILDRITLTMEIALFAMTISTLVGFVLGVNAAQAHGKWPDKCIRTVSLVGAAVPVYVSATLLLMVGSSVFGWIPPTGYISIFDDPFANLQLVLPPALILGVTSASGVIRMVRGSMIEVLSQDYIIRTAQSKGLNPKRIIYRHALRNAAIPVVTVLGVEFGVMLGGAVVTETILSLPGVGRLTVDAILQRDFPVIQGSILVIATLFIFVNIVTDLLYGVLDPRVSSSN